MHDRRSHRSWIRCGDRRRIDITCSVRSYSGGTVLGDIRGSISGGGGVVAVSRIVGQAVNYID